MNTEKSIPVPKDFQYFDSSTTANCCFNHFLTVKETKFGSDLQSQIDCLQLKKLDPQRVMQTQAW